MIPLLSLKLILTNEIDNVFTDFIELCISQIFIIKAKYLRQLTL